jgi:hypothetical protein
MSQPVLVAFYFSHLGEAVTLFEFFFYVISVFFNPGTLSLFFDVLLEFMEHLNILVDIIHVLLLLNKIVKTQIFSHFETPFDGNQMF